MKRFRTLLGIVLAVAVLAAAGTGCAAAKTTTSAYSVGIADTGYWTGVKALKYVKLCAYTGISVASDVYTITDEALQKEIDTILADYSTETQIKDRAIADGDTVNIDYVGSVDGVAFDGGSTNGAGTEVIIGQTDYVDDFIQQLIGHSPGESFDIEVTFPDDYGKDTLNGKDAVFAITVNYIAVKTAPVLTDDFVAQNLLSSHGWSTVAAMRDETRSSLQRSASEEYVQQYIVDNSTVSSLPKSLLKYQEDSLIRYYQKYADQYSVTLTEFLSTYLGVASTDALLKQYLTDNTKSATLYLITQAIAEDQGMKVTDTDLTAYFVRFLGTADYSTYETTYGLPYLKFMVLNQKVMDYLTENAVLE